MRTTLNGIDFNVFLETIDRLEVQSDGSTNPTPPSFNYLLSREPVFLRGPIQEMMEQVGYPDSIDWDALTEDGGLSLTE